MKYLLLAPKNYPIENYLNFFGDLIEVKFIGEKINPKNYKGLILIGGEDVNPKFYNEENLFKDLNEINEERDLFEFEMINEFLNEEKLIFGICRGNQIINVFFGGSLYQDLPSQLGTFIHKFYPEKTPKQLEIFNKDTYHKVKITSQNPIFEIMEFTVNSRHHQAVKHTSSEFYIFAISEDNVIEGIFHKKLLIFGVQWHPERINEKYNFSSKRILDFLRNVKF